MGVEFQEENVPIPARRPAQQQGITQFLIGNGIAKDAGQANAILLGVSILALAGMAFFFFSNSSSKNDPEPIPDPVGIVRGALS